MENSTKVALVALVIAIIACFLPMSGSAKFGGVTNYDELDAAGLRIGAGCNNSFNSANCLGSRLGGVYANSCSLIAATYTVAASTTVVMDCAVPGLVAGDGIEAQFGTSTQPLFLGWAITGASASSTSGFATFRIANMTGASAIIPSTLASTTQYEAFHLITSAPGL